VTNIESDHRHSTALEQAVGEPARRRAHVNRAFVVDVNFERVERRIELLTTAPDESSGGPVDHHRVTRCHEASALVGDRALDAHKPVRNQALGRLLRLGQSPTDQLVVEAAALCQLPVAFLADDAAFLAVFFAAPADFFAVFFAAPADFFAVFFAVAAAFLGALMRPSSDS